MQSLQHDSSAPDLTDTKIAKQDKKMTVSRKTPLDGSKEEETLRGTTFVPNFISDSFIFLLSIE